MAITDVYMDFGAATNGTGSSTSPFNNPFSGAAISDVRYIMSGTFYNYDQYLAIFPTDKLTKNNVTLVQRGNSSTRPKLSGLRTIPAAAWTSIGSNTYWAPVNPNGGAQYGGMCLRGGVPLKVCHLTAGYNVRATGIASMEMDSFLWDYTTGRMYIRISGTLSSDPIQVTTTRFGLMVAIDGNPISGFVVDGIIVEGVSVHGLSVSGMPGAQIKNSRFAFCGGERNQSAGYYLGNGIEFGYRSDGVLIDSCEIAYVYDSPVSPQLYDGTSATLNGFTIRNSTIYEGGLTGIEISTQGAGGIIKNGQVQSVEISKIGYGCSSWADSTNGNGSAISFWGSGASGSYVTDCAMDKCYIHDCQEGIVVLNRTGAADASRIQVSNSRILGGLARHTNGIHSMAESSSSGAVLTVQGSVIAKWTSGVNVDLAQAQTINLRNCGIIDNTTGVVRTAPGSVTLVNSLLQSNATIASGTGGSLTSNHNAKFGNTAVGTYSAGTGDVALGSAIAFDDLVYYMPVNGSPIFSTTGVAQTPVFSDAFGNSFSPGWPMSPYAAHAVPSGTGGTGTKPTSLTIARLGDSIMRGSDPYSGTNENGGPTGALPYVSPFGYIVANLMAAGITVTSVGIFSLAQPTRNGLANATACAARGGAVIKATDAIAIGQSGNSIEDNVNALYALYPTGIDVIFMDGGTNDFNIPPYDGSGIAAATTYIINLIRSKWPGVTIVASGPPPANWYTAAQIAPAQAVLSSMANGSTMLFANIWAPLVNFNVAANTIDGGHEADSGAQISAKCFTDTYLGSFTSTGGSGNTGGGSTGGTTTSISLLNTPAAVNKPGNGVTTATNTLGSTLPIGTLLVSIGGTWRGGTGGNITTTTDSEGDTFSHDEQIADAYGANSTCAFLNYALKQHPSSGALVVTDNFSDGYSTTAGIVLAFAGVDPAAPLRGAVQKVSGATSIGGRAVLSIPIDAATKAGDPIVVVMIADAFADTHTDVGWAVDTGWNLLPVKIDNTTGSPVVAVAWIEAPQDGAGTVTVSCLDGSGVFSAVGATFAAAALSTIGGADQVQVKRAYPGQTRIAQTGAQTYQLPNMPTQGNRLEITCAAKGSGVIVYTDNNGNGPYPLKYPSTVSTGRAEVVISPPINITNPSTPFIVTLTPTPSGATGVDWAFAVKELSNVHPTSPIRDSGAASETASSQLLDGPTAGTTTFVGDYVVSAIADMTAGALAITPPSGFTVGWNQSAGSSLIGGSAAFTYATADGVQHAAWSYAPSTNKAISTVSLRANDSAAVPVCVTGDLAAGSVGAAYSQTLLVRKGSPVVWSLTDAVAHPLPAGLALSPAGVLSGTPTVAGSFFVYATATNNTGAGAAIRAISITDTVPTITTTSPLTGGNVGGAYTAQLAATGTGPITWALTGGTLPPGLSLNTANGLISGTPTAAGTYSGILIKATNLKGPSAAVSFSITIGTATVLTKPAITADALPTGTIGVAYSYSIPASGSPTITFSAPSLPSGWALSSSGVLSCASPTALSGVSISVTPTNGAGAGPTKPLSLTVVAAPTAGNKYRYISSQPSAGSFNRRGKR